MASQKIKVTYSNKRTTGKAPVVASRVIRGGRGATRKG